jgi:hypothetical protein
MIKKFDIVSVVTNKRQEGEGLATVLGLTTFEGEEAAIIQYHFNNCPAQQVCTRFMKVHKQNRIDELEARLVIDKLNPNRREHIVQLTSRIDAVMKHIEERYDSQEPWTTPEEVKAILRGGLWS